VETTDPAGCTGNPQPISTHGHESLTLREASTVMHGGRDGRLETPSLRGRRWFLTLARAEVVGGVGFGQDPGRARPCGTAWVCRGRGWWGVPVRPSLVSVCIGPVSQGSDLVVCLAFLG
jgi:hypothetical protein